MSINKLDKFNFLIGNWSFKYLLPKSNYYDERSETGFGSLKRTLNGKYIICEYSTQSKREAKGLIGWDEKIKEYRFWWFHNSGYFSADTCYHIRTNSKEHCFAYKWYFSAYLNSCYVYSQTFNIDGQDNINLKMEKSNRISPLEVEKILILDVQFKRT